MAVLLLGSGLIGEGLFEIHGHGFSPQSARPFSMA
jgi:hypothetical protein